MLRLGQNVLEVFQGERFHLGAHWHSSLQLDDQVRWLLLLKGSRTNEQDVPGVHLRLLIDVDCRAVKYWQQVVLDTFITSLGRAILLL